MNKELKKFVIEKKALFWSVSDPAVLSLEVIVETILNYGDWDDVQFLLSIVGQKKVSGIFFKQLKKERNNYRPKIANYFTLYFHKHA